LPFADACPSGSSIFALALLALVVCIFQAFVVLSSLVIVRCSSCCFAFLACLLLEFPLHADLAQEI